MTDLPIKIETSLAAHVANLVVAGEAAIKRIAELEQENEKLKASQKAYFHSIDHMSIQAVRDEIKRVGDMVASLYNAQDNRSEARKAFDGSIGDLGQL